MAWTIDSSHSAIHFSVRHMMISTVRGEFRTFNGTVDFNQDNPIQSKVYVEVDTASISTRDEKRDGHLQSADFFDSENYPVAIFKSTRAEQTGETTGKLYGDLTIRTVTKPVVLDVEFNGLAKSPWGTTSAGFSATGKISRKEWDLNWNAALETGGVLVGDDIKLEIDVEVVQQPEAQPEAETVTTA